MNRILLRALTVAVLLAPLAATTAPLPKSQLKLAAPIKLWDEALPIGNGLMGGLLWGEGRTLRLSLDRGDLWDERRAPGYDEQRLNYATLLKLKAEGKFDDMNRIMDAPYDGVTPTKLPGGRIEFDLPPEVKLKTFTLNLATAEARAESEAGVAATVFAHARRPILLLSLPQGVSRIRLLTTGDVAAANAGARESSSAGGVARLGYAPAEKGAQGDAQWYVQPGADGFKYCVYIQKSAAKGRNVYAVVMTSTADGADLLAIARQRATAALREGYDKALKSHRDWWRRFWEKSSVTLPDAAAQLQYDLANYFLGSASRRGSPPMPLQGVWTADNGQLPPWKGDYHNDLNTQMTYLSYRDAGRFDEGLTYLDFLWQLRPKFQQFAREFYGTGGGNTPGVMTLAGNPLGGWGQYSFSPTMGAWSAQLFYAHWLHTGDKSFLADRAYPWCADVGTSLKELLKPDESGRLVLPLSSSPEVFDNSARAWLQPNSNYDLMCLRMLFLALHEMAVGLQKTDAAAEWQSLADKLGDYHVGADGRLLLDAVTKLPGSHRHLSNLMGIYPFNLITIEGSDEDRRRIKASLADWDQSGTRAWVGYSFSWMSALRARVGDAEGALKYLSIFNEAFVSRNGFHLNGDQLKKGYSGFQYRPFTLEGNFLAAQAVQEMLLQSWSPMPGTPNTSIIRVFPAVADAWPDVSFDSLVAAGGHRVTAKRAGGKTVALKFEVASNGVLRVRDNFNGRLAGWSVKTARKVGANYEIPVKRGQTVTARFAD